MIRLRGSVTVTLRSRQYEECCQALTRTDQDLARMSREERADVESPREWLGDWRPEDFALMKRTKRFDR